MFEYLKLPMRRGGLIYVMPKRRRRNGMTEVAAATSWLHFAERILMIPSFVSLSCGASSAQMKMSPTNGGEEIIGGGGFYNMYRDRHARATSNCDCDYDNMKQSMHPSANCNEFSLLTSFLILISMLHSYNCCCYLVFNPWVQFSILLRNLWTVDGSPWRDSEKLDEWVGAILHGNEQREICDWNTLMNQIVRHRRRGGGIRCGFIFNFI